MNERQPSGSGVLRAGLLVVAVALVLASFGCEEPRRDQVADVADVIGDTSGGDAVGADVDALCDVRSPALDVTLPVFELVVSDAHLAELNEDIHADIDVPAELRLDGRRWDIEVEYHGASARRYQKKSFRLKFEGDDPFRAEPGWFDSGSDGLVAEKRLSGMPNVESYRRLVLKAMVIDRSFVREVLAFDLLRALGGHAPRVAFVELRLNGDYRGLYILEEPVDEDFLERRDFEDGGALYKGVQQRADFKPGRDLTEGFDKKTRRDEPWDDLEDLVERFQTTPTTMGAYRAIIDPIYRLDAHIDRMIWVSYTQNCDTASQNFYLYAEPRDGDEDDEDDEDDRRLPLWHMLAWDSDISFSNHWDSTQEVFDVEWRHLLDGRNYFGRRFVLVEELRHQLVDRFEGLLDTALAPEAVMPLAERLFTRVEGAVLRDRARWDVERAPQLEFDEIRDFIERRPDILREKLTLFRDDPGALDD